MQICQKILEQTGRVAGDNVCNMFPRGEGADETEMWKVVRQPKSQDKILAAV